MGAIFKTRDILRLAISVLTCCNAILGHVGLTRGGDVKGEFAGDGGVDFGSASLALQWLSSSAGFLLSD